MQPIYYLADNKKQSNRVSFLLIVLVLVINFTFMSAAEITPVADRTSVVRDAIVAAIADVDTAADVTAAHLATITNLNLRGKDISELKTDDFSGLSGLENLNLYGNKLSSLPAGIFEGLTSLKVLRLGKNAVDPLPLTVSLVKVSSGQFKVVVPAGAPFDLVIPVHATHGSIVDGASTVTISRGSVGSALLKVERTPGTTASVTVAIGTLPKLPRNHYGYTFVKSDDAPLVAISEINTAPVFTEGESVTRSVPENTAAAADIGTPITATDPENDVLTYTLSGPDASAFDIDSSTGQLKTKAALDYETETTYSVTITVSDGTLTDTITVTINVTDVDEDIPDDPPPDPPVVNMAPVFVEGVIARRVVLENTLAGTPIGIPVRATDTAGDSLTWTLGGVDAAAFDIDSSTGQLKTKAALDYETKRVYTVTITVADEELSDTILVIISVIDVNDTVIKTDFVSVATRTPAVRDAIVAAIEGVDSAADVTAAHLATITDLNLRGKDISELKTDDFSGLSGLENLNLYGNKLSSLPAGIFEGLTSLKVLRLGKNAVDPLPLNVLLEGVASGQFKAVVPAGAPFDLVIPVHATHGSIADGVSTVTISRGSVGSALLKVERTPGTTASVTVAIGTLPKLPRNHFGYTFVKSDDEPLVAIPAINTAPVFTEGESVTRSVPENTAAAADIGTPITATDPENDVLTYTLSGPDASAFDIDSSTGQLKTKAALDYETETTYSITITVSDGTLTDTITVTINVTDIDEDIPVDPPPDPPVVNMAPVFVEGEMTRRVVLENTPAGTPIGIPVRATDTAGDSLTWTLGGVDADAFDIDSSTGQLKTKAALDYETKRVYTISITVEDSELSDTILVVISVIDVNDTEISADFVSVATRTPAVRDAIVAAIADVDTAADVTAAHLATITQLNLRGKGIAELKTGDFAGLTALTNLNLYGNMLRTLPNNIFTGLTALTSLRMSKNAVDPMLLTVALQQVNLNTFKAIIPTGAPFDVVLTINGSRVTVLKGSRGSAVFSSNGLPSIDAFPKLPATHFGYIFGKSTACHRTSQVSDAIVAAVAGVNDCQNVSEVDLATITSLDLSGTDIAVLRPDDFEGMISLTELYLANNKLSSLPSGIFKDLASLRILALNDNNLTSLSGEVFANLTGLTTVNLANNSLTALPAGIFEGLTSLDELQLTGNAVMPLPIAVSLQKVGQDQFMVRVPAGAPWTLPLPITVKNGAIGSGVKVITIPVGEVESSPVTVTRTSGTFDAVTVELGTLPNLPATHNGYALVQSGTSPLEVFEPLNQAPVFTEGESTTRFVAENTATSKDIGDAVKATDPDTADTLTYTLSGTDVSVFTIDGKTGQLKTKAALDYETKKTYTVVVTVSDGEISDTITVTINVTDIDENRAPVFTEGETTTRSVAENTAAGENIGTAIAATDPDNDTLTYSLAGTDAGSFGIDTETGQLKTSVTLDYETKTVYTVVINVSDGKLTTSITVTIRVTDVAEVGTPVVGAGGDEPKQTANNPPVFTEGDSTTRSVFENAGGGVDIGTPVTATDVDGHTLTYTLSGTDAEAFTIDGKTGQLRTEAPLDYETKSTYTLTMTADDGNLTDTITITINVIDLDETRVNNAPVFTEGDSTTRSVPENTGSGVDIGKPVAATDEDGNTLVYSISGTDASAFSLDTSSGQLRTSSALNFEEKAVYQITLTVSDGSSTDTIDVTINVESVNEAPVFTEGNITTRTIPENTPANVNIGTVVSATDANNDPLTYTLGGTDATSFDIETTTGQLKTKAVLDYETKTSYSVTVAASDGKGGTNSIAVTINVTDLEERVANRPPVFTDGESTTREVAENTAAGQNIGSPVGATDADEDTLVYLLGGTDSSAFRINDNTGQLQTDAPLDYESKAVYNVTVIANDGSTTVSIAVTINVTDANDAPIFTDGTSTTREVAENTATGQNIGTAITATDADEDTLTYSLTGTDAASFDIVSTSGQLRTKAALDYEDTNAYTVTVEVSDGNEGSDSITVTINVSDVSENRAPVFTDGTSTTRSIPENTAAGRNIGSPVAATDADGDPLTYTLGGTDANAFSIYSTNGQLRTKAALDYEAKRSYTVTVEVSDGNGGTDSITVTINVADVNEERAPVFTDGSVTTRYVAENTSSGTNIGAPVSATDANNDVLTYSLSGTDSASFDIVSTSGQLQTKAALDYEDQSSYSVIINVSDGKGGTDSITVTIRVTNVNENNAPVFIGVKDNYWYVFRVDENTPAGQNIGDPISATDADGDPLSYSTAGDDADHFEFDSTTRQFKTKGALDYETKRRYQFTVTVSDGNGGTDTAGVIIDVLNVNENRAPVFTEGSSTTRDVPENTSSGTNIGAPVSATDANNDVLTYSLSGTDGASFDIVSTSGQLRTKAALDYEEKTSYTVIVYVSDGEGGTDSITVTINVTDVTENNAPVTENNAPVTENNAPVFTGASYWHTRSVDENTAAGQNIGDPITATDADEDTLTYSISGTDAGHFDIVSTTGQLQTKGALDYDTKTQYIITVKVSDGKGGTDTAGVSIYVRQETTVVEEEEETTVAVPGNNPPVLTGVDEYNWIIRYVDSNTPAGQNIGDPITATDADEDTLTYSISGTDAGHFDIVSETGQLQTKGALDYDTKTLYNNIKVKVSDGRGGTDTANVVIHVRDIGDTTGTPTGAFPSHITPLQDRTKKIRTAIIKASPVKKAKNVTVAHLAAITALTVSGTNMTSLNSGDFSGLTSLTSLDLSDNEIDSLSSGVFAGLTSLTSLDLSDNYLASLSSGVFGDLTSLTSLDLSDNEIDSLSSGVFDNLTSLTSLDLHNNYLASLSSGIFDKLTSLTSLDLYWNSLETLPSDIFDALTSLTSVDLSLNDDIELPAGFVAKLTQRGISVTLGDNVRSEDQEEYNEQYEDDDEDDNGGEAPFAPVPSSTALFVNYPNPFNPETWIPYQLSQPSQVTLTIYDVRGVAVRTLNIGWKPAGYYISRSRAAYWDGKNSVGVQVASGVYFYTLTAGEFTATRKMFIRK